MGFFPQNFWRSPVKFFSLGEAVVLPVSLVAVLKLVLALLIVLQVFTNRIRMG